MKKVIMSAAFLAMTGIFVAKAQVRVVVSVPCPRVVVRPVLPVVVRPVVRPLVVPPVAVIRPLPAIRRRVVVY